VPVFFVLLSSNLLAGCEEIFMLPNLSVFFCHEVATSARRGEPSTAPQAFKFGEDFGCGYAGYAALSYP